MVDFKQAAEVLRPHVVYSLPELCEALPGLDASALMDARRDGLIDGLGYGPQTHLLGLDVIRFIEQRSVDGERQSTASPW